MQSTQRHVYTKEFILSIKDKATEAPEQLIESLGPVALSAPPIQQPQPSHPSPQDSFLYNSNPNSKPSSRAIPIPSRSSPFAASSQTSNSIQNNGEASSLPNTSYMSFNRGFDSTQNHPIQHRRRSPSPPLRALSASPPPGFGKLPTLPRTSPNAIRDAFRSRIAKGPDISANFQTRIQYHENKQNARASDDSPSNDTEEKKESTTEDLFRPIQNNEIKKDTDVEDSSPGNQIPDEIERLFSSEETQPAKPIQPVPAPIVVETTPQNDNKSDQEEDPFDAFARSLAALASKSEEPISPEKEKTDDDKQNGFAQFSDFRNTSTNHHAEDSTENNQEEMDALSQWFGSIAASASKDTTSTTNVTIMESSHTRKPFQTSAQENVELDPNVLSYFMSIRAQAANDATWESIPSLNNGIQSLAYDGRSMTSRPLPIGQSPLRTKQPFPSMDEYRTLHEDDQHRKLWSESEDMLNGRSSESNNKQHADSENNQNSTCDASAFGNLEQWFSALAVAEEMKQSQ